MSRYIYLALVFAVAIYGSNGDDSKDYKDVDSPSDCVGGNREWNDWGTLCPLKCGEPMKKLCPPRRYPNCACKKGYVETKRGDCVLPENCPASEGKPY